MRQTLKKHLQDRKTECKYFLENSYVGILATCDVKHSSYASNIFIVFNGEKLIFKSRTESLHSLYASDIERSVGFAIYSHDSNYMQKYGVQLTGKIKRILSPEEMEKAVELYDMKFTGARSKLPADLSLLCANNIKSTFYYLEIDKFKIIDEGFEGNRTMLEYDKF